MFGMFSGYPGGRHGFDEFSHRPHNAPPPPPPIPPIPGLAGHYIHRELRSRLFEKGDLKYVILDLLRDKPRHGYDIIRELEDRFHGLYTPSAGSVYPILQLLEDMALVKSSELDGKKVYTLLDEGRKYLAERRETVSRIQNHMKDWGADREEIRESVRAFRELAQLLRRRAHLLDAERLTRIKDLVRRARQDIENITGESRPPTAPESNQQLPPNWSPPGVA